jgi:hypothetical protein
MLIIRFRRRANSAAKFHYSDKVPLPPQYDAADVGLKSQIGERTVELLLENPAYNKQEARIA